MSKLSTRQEEILDFIKDEVKKKKDIHHPYVKLAKLSVLLPVQRFTAILPALKKKDTYVVILRNREQLKYLRLS